MLRSPLVWIAALWVGVMIHVDWHLGRSGHDHQSFNLSYHWLVAVPTFIPVVWLALRRWPTSAFPAGAVILLIGVMLGQGLEPLGETIHFNAGSEPFTNPQRWRIFAEFLGAGIITLVGGIMIARWRHR